MMFLSIKDQLIAFDRWLFLVINQKMANPFFDVLMPFMREGLHWTPLYIFLIVFMIMNFKKTGAWWVLFFIASVALTDIISAQILKDSIQRIRPCRDPFFGSQVRLVADYCSSSYSFTSNHASNHFCMAMFFYFTTRRLLGKWAAIGFIWAAIICFAQVYVGIHYPFDILGGATLGILIAWLVGRVFINRFGYLIFGYQPTLNT